VGSPLEDGQVNRAGPRPSGTAFESGIELGAALREILDDAPEPWVAFDIDGRHLFSNRAFDRMVGIDGSELVGKSAPFAYWPAEDAEEIGRLFAALIRGDYFALRVRSVELQWHAPDGRAFPVVVSGKLLSDSLGEPVAHLLSLLDLSATTGTVHEGEPSDARTDRLREGLRRIARELESLGFGETGGPLAGIRTCPELDTLSPRERQVAERLLAGDRVPMISRALRISPATVRTHLKSIFRKLGVRSQAALIEKLRPLGAD
jgi:PAS domain S-box-containing protein